MGYAVKITFKEKNEYDKRKKDIKVGYLGPDFIYNGRKASFLARRLDPSVKIWNRRCAAEKRLSAYVPYDVEILKFEIVEVADENI